MLRTIGRLRSIRPDDSGTSLVEYALLVALLALACVGSLTFFGSATGGSLSRSNSSMFVTTP